MLAALALALVLSAIWALRDRANLSVLRLPDTDDVMRLQQVRDWLGGQRFADVAQHRMGAGTLPMHWSRLADLLPAATIATLAPLIGRHHAELAAVIATPAALFAVALLLVARIARQVAGAEAARTAAVVAAIAYPATTIFLPGRIDHHGLQVVLLLGATLATLRPTLARGACAGVLAAAGLVVGLETAPLLAVLGACVIGAWVSDGERDATRSLAGLGIGAFVALLGAGHVFATDGWSYPACDGFAAPLWRAALPVAIVPIVLASTRSWLTIRGMRLAATALAGGVAAAVALRLSPGCLSPYGAVDPELARLWLGRVGEAQSPFTAPLATSVGYLGLMLAGLVASALRLRHDRSRGWVTLLALQLAALAIACIQLRGAYAGAMLAAPALAATIGAARRRGGLRLSAAWLGSAGMLYPIAAEAVTPPAASGTGEPCDAVAALAALRPGVVVAPIDAGAWGIAATPHRFLAAPYHRNAAADLAMYRIFLGDPASARAIATRWRVDYLLFCGGDLAPLAPAPSSLAGHLATGRVPAWLTPLGGARDLYRIAR